MDRALTVTCPLTGRLGSYVPGRDQRPGPPRLRGVVTAPAGDCPFCTGDVPSEPHPARATRGEVRWTSCPNRYPAVVGVGATAHVVYAERHDPPLTVDAPTQRDDWAAMLDAQQQLAGRSASWSLLIVNVGPTAGASQDHPHGQVLDLPEPPPIVVERTRRLGERSVAAEVLAGELTVERRAGMGLVVPAVPFGPDDLRLVPEAEGDFRQADPDAVAAAIVRWLTTLTAEDTADAGRREVKVVVHERVEGAGRWYVDLLATDRHGPVAGITPFAELDEPPTLRAARLRERLRRG
jgi:galactose-1-phosphate uridylyltransferase